MSQIWHLGGQVYSMLAELGPRDASGRMWRLVRREPAGGRFLLQTWDPRPPDRELDAIRDSFLRTIADASPLDLMEVHFGFDDGRLWFLQGLQGTPLAKLWPDWSVESRAIFQHQLQRVLDQDRCPRFLHPEAIGLKPGRILVPRVIGPNPWEMDRVTALLPDEVSPDSRVARMWEQAPELSDPAARPIRGRLQEMTYLKSLVLGFNAPAPMERIVVLHGEEGLGVERLAAWAVASAETDGQWVSRLEVQAEDSAGVFFERLLHSLMHGREAELYSRSPELARTLARRMEAFAFLRGGRRSSRGAPIDPEEIRAALEVIEEATSFHPRLVHVEGVERADAGLAEMLKELVLRSRMPWIISASGSGPCLKGLLGPLKADVNSAYVVLSRVEDDDMSVVLGDILRDHRLPRGVVDDICRASLGNPGLLESILELAQIEGKLVWSGGTWLFNPSASTELKMHEDLLSEVLAGRLQRMNGASAAVVKTLALAGRPLAMGTLGKALGLAGEPFDQAMQPVLSARLAHVVEGRIALADGRLRDLALSEASRPECARLARALLGALEEEAGQPVLSVRLQSYVSDRATALGQVMKAIEGQLPDPGEAGHVVQEALNLEPNAPQRARLYEFLADAWSQGSASRLVQELEPGLSPARRTLDALDRALAAMEESPDAPEEGRHEHLARVLVKKASMELKLGLLEQAERSAARASEYLADHPFHPDQIRLRLVHGRIHLTHGAQAKGIRELEEGLKLLEMKGPRADHHDQVALLQELGRALAHRSQFQRASGLLQSAQRLIEHSQESKGHVGVLLGLSELHQIQGQPDQAYYLLREALRSARSQGMPFLQARVHLAIGMLCSLEHYLSPALSHLDGALERFTQLGDSEMLNRARLWKARTLAALGDSVQCELLVLQACAAGTRGQPFLIRGDQAFLQAEVAGFQDAWRDAGRLYQVALESYESGGLVGRSQLAALRRIQAEAQEVLLGGRRIPLEPLWERLENLKAPSEGSGSRWVEMEWCRAHGMLLATSDATDPVVMEALQAWGQVLRAAREMRFPQVVLEAASRCALLLLDRGERLGARTRIQDAFPSYQEIWNHVPDGFETSFLGRADMHRFRLAVEGAGLKFITPEKADPLMDWTPTLATSPMLKFPGTDR